MTGRTKQEGPVGDISGGSRRLPDGGSLGLAADGRASVSRGDLSRCAEEELAVVDQFCDARGCRRARCAVTFWGRAEYRSRYQRLQSSFKVETSMVR